MDPLTGGVFTIVVLGVVAYVAHYVIRKAVLSALHEFFSSGNRPLPTRDGKILPEEKRE
ncbi:hypothetical protein ACI3EY_17040 [Ornithinimicrobium sp. LYQ92]|uniref:hypothetical protein n=1 Tax=Serinicoccus sp. LYQ92 TaxID=3378798 RepID=UPI00385515BC